jgi:transposase
MEGSAMAKALSTDLRDRVARYVLAGHSRRQAAKVFGIGTSSAIRYVAQYQATGGVEPARQGGDRRSKLKDHRDYLLRRVQEVPDISLSELEAELKEFGVAIHQSNICRFLKAQGLTFKKNAGRSRTEKSGHSTP